MNTVISLFSLSFLLLGQSFSFFSLPNLTTDKLPLLVQTETTNDLPMLQKTHLISVKPLPQWTLKETRSVIVTAYSSTPDQTDSTPFITASGSFVRPGIVACNFLPFGTKVQFPYLFGSRIFVVEDRLAPKNSHKIDIWFPNRTSALKFGRQKTIVYIYQQAK